ncbi:hypothetical protein BD310DRAFT_779045, partial [Dichomitus squalens]
QWDDARQALYESHIARLTAAGSWSLSWTESPQWLSFCDNFLPMGVINPTRKVLTSRIIPAEVEVYRTQARTECRQKLGTVQCDGFNPKNRHHIVAFMLTVPDKKETRVYTIRTYDTSNEPKTAENLLKMLREVLQLLREEWRVIVIAVTSDCSGESRKARVEIVKELPHLIAPDCYAHQ